MKAPGRSEREGTSLMELFDRFPDDPAAEAWFEAQRWPHGRTCPDCGSKRTVAVKQRKPMPYRCQDCRKHFSVRKGTVMQSSKLGCRTWVVAIYLVATSLKGVSSMKLHRDLQIRQPTAWHLAQRIRKGYETGQIDKLAGPVEADEAYFGGKNKNRHARQRHEGVSGPAGKAAVVGVKDRATNQIRAAAVATTEWHGLRRYVQERIQADAQVYTDDHPAYRGLRNHAAVQHSAGEYVDGDAHTNGMESFWCLLKRGYYGTYHRLSPKHLDRYVAKFAGQHNQRALDTIDQMAAVSRGLTGKRLRYRDLGA